MTTETDHTPSAESGGNWRGYQEQDQEPAHGVPPDERAAAEDATGAATDERPDFAEPDRFEPAAVAAEQESGLASPEGTPSPAAPRIGTSADEDPLLTPEAASGLLDRWTEIQVSFVENPRAAVQDADALVQEIATVLMTSLQDRQDRLAAAWQQGQPDTEALRLALWQYRSFISVVLPR